MNDFRMIHFWFFVFLRFGLTLCFRFSAEECFLSPSCLSSDSTVIVSRSASDFVFLALILRERKKKVPFYSQKQARGLCERCALMSSEDGVTRGDASGFNVLCERLCSSLLRSGRVRQHPRPLWRGGMLQHHWQLLLQVSSGVLHLCWWIQMCGWVPFPTTATASKSFNEFTSPTFRPNIWTQTAQSWTRCCVSFSTSFWFCPHLALRAELDPAQRSSC